MQKQDFMVGYVPDYIFHVECTEIRVVSIFSSKSRKESNMSHFLTIDSHQFHIIMVSVHSKIKQASVNLVFYWRQCDCSVFTPRKIEGMKEWCLILLFKTPKFPVLTAVLSSGNVIACGCSWDTSCFHSCTIVILYQWAFLCFPQQG